jgi:hypothetical protein
VEVGGILGVLVLVLPLLGVIIWYFAGPREST